MFVNLLFHRIYRQEEQREELSGIKSIHVLTCSHKWPKATSPASPLAGGQGPCTVCGRVIKVSRDTGPVRIV